MEAVEFNHLLSEFKALNTSVVGVSADSVERLRRFQQKHALGFPLVSDSERAIGRAYGTLKSAQGAHERDTVLIGTDGTILLSYQRVRAKGHAAQVLVDARGLREKGLI